MVFLQIEASAEKPKRYRWNNKDNLENIYNKKGDRVGAVIS